MNEDKTIELKTPDPTIDPGRKTIYVCSPLAGEIEENIRMAREFSKFAAQQGATPIAPHITEIFNDLIPEERELGLATGIDYLRKADELWVFGDHISSGMAKEIELAQNELHIPIYHVDTETHERLPFGTNPTISNDISVEPELQTAEVENSKKIIKQLLKEHPDTKQVGDYYIVDENDHHALGYNPSLPPDECFALFEQHSLGEVRDRFYDKVDAYQPVNPKPFENMSKYDWYLFETKYSLTPPSSLYSDLYNLVEAMPNNDFYRHISVRYLNGDTEDHYLNDEVKCIQQLVTIHDVSYLDFAQGMEVSDVTISKEEYLAHTQNPENALFRKPTAPDTAKLPVGSVISVPVQFADTEYKSLRTMMIIGTTESGDYLCNNLTSKKQYKDNDKYPGNVFVSASSENGLKYDSYIKCDKQFVVPYDAPGIKKTHAHIQPETLDTVKAVTNRLESIETTSIVNNSDNNDQSLPAEEKIKSILADFKTSPELFAEFASFSAQFYDYSFRNKLLIYMQAPYSTFVASYTHWQELGYNVQRNEKGISIYRPVETTFFIRNGEKVSIKEATNDEKAKIGSGEIKTTTDTNFIKHTVFDVSQTNCPKENYPQIYSMGYADLDKRTLYEAAKDFAETSGFSVQEKELKSISINGYCDTVNGAITINTRLEDSEKLNTLLHELAHGLLHKTSTQEIPVMEFEAEALSVMLQHKFNLPIDDNSKNYLCNSYKQINKDKFKPDASFSRLSKAMKFVDKGVTDRLAEKGVAMEQNKNISLEKSGISENASSALSNQNFLQEL